MSELLGNFFLHISNVFYRQKLKFTPSRFKIKCCKCDKIAIWLYAPSDHNNHCCDDHVPRGCSCQSNQDYVIENCVYDDKGFMLDEKGRRKPCIEYWYDKNGWIKSNQ